MTHLLLIADSLRDHCQVKGLRKSWTPYHTITQTNEHASAQDAAGLMAASDQDRETFLLTIYQALGSAAPIRDKVCLPSPTARGAPSVLRSECAKIRVCYGLRCPECATVRAVVNICRFLPPPGATSAACSSCFISACAASLLEAGVEVPHTGVAVHWRLYNVFDV